MKTIIRHLMEVLFIVLICGFATAEETPREDAYDFKEVSQDDIPFILEMLADTSRDNYKQIRTWEGKMLAYIQYLYEGEAAERIFESRAGSDNEAPRALVRSFNTVIEFVLDAEGDRLFAHRYPSEPVRYRNLDTGKELGIGGIALDRIKIFTPDYEIVRTVDTRHNGIAMTHRAVKEKRKRNDSEFCGGNTATSYDPRKNFGVELVQNTLSSVLAILNQDYDWESETGGYRIKAKKAEQNGVLKYLISVPGRIAEERVVFNTMVFSENKGFNITLNEATDSNGKVFQKATWDYELVNEVYVLKEVSQKNYMNESGGLSFSKRIEFTNRRVNEPLSDKTFTYKDLQLNDGDKFINKITGKDYIYQNGQLTEFQKNTE